MVSSLAWICARRKQFFGGKETVAFLLFVKFLYFDTF